MKYPIKNFNASMRGAPTKNGTPGSFISILKACLIELLFNREEYPKNLIEKLLSKFFT